LPYIGHGYVKLVRKVQNEEKTLAKMEGGGFVKKVVKDKVLTFKFIDVGKLPPPIL
jgi:ATP-binding cassette subfamily F protein 2